MEQNDKLKILLIINPHAGKMKSRAGLFDIVSLLNEGGHHVTVHCTTGAKNATFITKEQSKDYDLVVCCGGDGTLNEVISGTIPSQSPRPIGYLPAGSTNDFARTLQIPTNLKKATKLVMSGTPTSLDIGFLNKEFYFSYVASFGTFSKISYSTPQRWKNRLGHFAYIANGIRHIPEIHPYNVTVSTDEFSVTGEFIFGSVTNTTSIGGIVSLKKEDVSLNDGKFEVLLVRNPHNPSDLTDILRGLLRQKYDARHVLFFHTDKISFQFEKAASWTVDGEFGGKHTDVAIENLHNAVQVISDGSFI